MASHLPFGMMLIGENRVFLTKISDHVAFVAAGCCVAGMDLDGKTVITGRHPGFYRGAKNLD